MFCLQMKCLVEVSGQPEDHMLHSGEYTQLFFSEVEAAVGPAWTMKVEYFIIFCLS